jgi:hypothetical protein
MREPGRAGPPWRGRRDPTHTHPQNIVASSPTPAGPGSHSWYTPTPCLGKKSSAWYLGPGSMSRRKGVLRASEAQPARLLISGWWAGRAQEASGAPDDGQRLQQALLQAEAVAQEQLRSDRPDTGALDPAPLTSALGSAPAHSPTGPLFSRGVGGRCRHSSCTSRVDAGAESSSDCPAAGGQDLSRPRPLPSRLQASGD